MKSGPEMDIAASGPPPAIIIIIIIISVGSRWDYAHGRGPGPAPGELGLSAAKRAIDNWYVGDGQVRR